MRPSVIAGILEEPVVIEILLSLVVTGILWLFVRRLLRIARRLDQRRALREFVRGMDHYLRGEHDRAVEELTKVLDRDPENMEARIALGDALRELGQAAEAHRHHYHVRQVFGHEQARNDLSLGRDLLALGDAEAAIPELERAFGRGAEDDLARRDLRDAYLKVERYEEAVAAAREVLDGAGEDGTREEARRTLGRALTLAAGRAMEQDDSRSAQTWLEEAVRIAPELVPARMELVRTKLLSNGPRAGSRAFAQALQEMRRLAAEDEIVFEPLVGGPMPHRETSEAAAPVGPAAATLPEPTETRPLLEAPASSETLPAVRNDEPSTELQTTASAAPPALPEDVLAPDDMSALLDRAARAFCELCGRTARDWTERCPGCGAYGAMRPRNTARLQAIPRPRDVLDEIEENRAYVRRLCRRLATGNLDAAVPLGRLGRRAVSLVFREALAVSDPRALTGTMARMGERVLPDLLESWRRARAVLTRRRARRRSADEILVTVLVGMGGAAAPALRDLLERPEAEVRLLALESLLRLGLLDVVEEARLLFGVRDIVDRLNALDEETVSEIVDAAKPDSHLVTTVLPDRTFLHERALVEAFVQGDEPGRRKVEGILRARGYSPELVAALLAHADDRVLRPVVFELIEGYGADAADHLLTAVVDPSLSPETRALAGDLLRQFGIPSLEKLLDGAADRPGRIAEGVVDLLGSLGDDGVLGLSRAYASGGWLSKIGLGREKIHGRRGLIIRALVRVGTEPAIMALREIRMRETDPGLRGEADRALGTLEAD